LNKITSIILIVLLILPVANAITGSIGNAKAIIKTEVQEGKTTVIERTILVKNVNDVPLNITLETGDDLKNIVELIDSKFVLQPKEEKKARFNLNIERPGNYSGKISVFFTPQDKGNGVVLASSLVILAYGEGNFPEEEQPENDTVVDNPEDDEDNETGVSISVGGGKVTNNSSSKISNNLVFIIIMIIILLLIVGGSIYFLRKW
jgi:hypothetical protein